MTDADPAGRPANPRRRGLMGLFDRLRGRQPEPESPIAEEAPTVAGELVSQAQAFEDLRVEDVMRPRAGIVAIDKGCTFAELVAHFAESRTLKPEEVRRLKKLLEEMDDGD